MDIKEIKQIVDLMKRSDLIEFEIEEDNFKLRLKRHHPDAEPGLPTMPPVVVGAPAVSAPPAPAPTSGAEPAGAAAPPAGEVIKSPMVGTFYRAPNPESPSFVEIGTSVTPDSVVCIIEAMKVMNEIQSELTGKVAEVLVENGQSVEYGQPLFRLQP